MKPKKLGRPKLKHPRNRHVGIRVSDVEYDALCDVAQLCKRIDGDPPNISDAVRNLLAAYVFDPGQLQRVLNHSARQVRR